MSDHEKNTIESSNELQLPDFCLIPLYVRKNKNLSESAKIYYGELNVFTMKYGYSWATDAQLAKMKEVDISTIEKWNTQLEKEGYIRRETRNKLFENPEGKPYWRKTRRIYMSFPVENENSNNSSDTAKNDGSIEPSKNDGSIEPSKNEGLNIKQKSKEKTKPEEPSPVVFSSLSKLKIEDSLAAKVSNEHSESDVDLAVERCLSWDKRPSDKVGLLTALSKKDTWEDRETPEQLIEKNTDFLKSIAEYDSMQTRFGTIYIGPTYFEVAAITSTHLHLKIDEPDFIVRVNEFLRKIQ